MSHSKLQSQLCSQLISKTHNNERAQSKRTLQNKNKSPTTIRNKKSSNDTGEESRRKEIQVVSLLLMVSLLPSV